MPLIYNKTDFVGPFVGRKSLSSCSCLPLALVRASALRRFHWLMYCILIMNIIYLSSKRCQVCEMTFRDVRLFAITGRGTVGSNRASNCTTALSACAHWPPRRYSVAGNLANTMTSRGHGDGAPRWPHGDPAVVVKDVWRSVVARRCTTKPTDRM